MAKSKYLGNIYKQHESESNDGQIYWTVDMSANDKLEKEIYDFFKENLPEGEEITKNTKIHTTDGKVFVFDFMINPGCKLLKAPHPIFIEYRNSLQSNTLIAMKRKFDVIREKTGAEPYFFLIFDDTNRNYGYISDVSESDHTRIYGFNQLKNLFIILKKLEEGKVKKENKDKQNVKEAEKPAVQKKIEDTEEEKRDYFEELKDLLIEENCTPMLGAGVSIDAGVPDWRGLLIGLIQRSKGYDWDKAEEYFDRLQRDHGSSFLIVARILFMDMPDQTQRNEWIREILYDNRKGEGKLIPAIAKLITSRKINQVITFNFDTLLEDLLNRPNEKCMSIFDKEHLIKDKFPVYHVHGIVRNVKNENGQNPMAWVDPILSEEDYHKLYGESNNWSNVVMQHALNHSHCIMIGLSMNDPNLRRLLDISKKGKSKPVAHYALMGKSPDYEEEYYKKQENILRQLGVQVLWYDIKEKDGKPDHSGLTELVNKLR